jgi:hypothetical protein
MRRTLTVILASDVAGYSRLVADREEETIDRFRQAATIFTDLVKKYQGAGMLEFRSWRRIGVSAGACVVRVQVCYGSPSRTHS